MLPSFARFWVVTNTGILRAEAARSIFSAVKTLLVGWLFGFNCSWDMGFVQFGELVDSIAEFFLDVADALELSQILKLYILV